MGSLAPAADFTHASILHNPELLESRGLIDGSWRTAANGKTFSVFEPSTGEILGSVGDFGEEDFIAAIQSAHVAFRDFSLSTTAKERATLLTRWEQLILDNADDCKLTRAISRRITH